MSTRVAELTTDGEWDAAVPLLRQLWSHETEAFVRSWREEDDYRLFGLFEAGEGATADSISRDEGDLVAVVGVSVQRVLHHARHAWIHDLVVDEPRRGEGYGAELLDFVEEWAAERDCEYVALASRAGNDAALSFYEDEGMERWGYVVETEL
ncbi:GNAT family N-acetyltransferase [Halostella sp. JP-L12]|uniref:GNAT family N-acetyltransferase n=1 Tax=Halostella TaxID=1843185 RepID=UPI000EF7CAEC|nr:MULTISPECIES: GNAT family N-acetyltransferase [Halostella]NHN48969.1 GNAT family N-acetyltransferase [Halostella sp. JP-L12]